MQSRLLVPNCPHAAHALFSAHYLRSNRTRAPKVLRCFPHCCPGHRARSYCGAPIHVVVSLDAGAPVDHATASRRDRGGSRTGGGDSNEPSLVVFGHFERETGDEESHSDLVVGQRVQLQDILDDGPSWVRGLAPASTQTRHDNGTRSMTFTFNDDEYCHWLYDWNSGTSQRERARLHYFRVYVFRQSERQATSPGSSGSSLRGSRGNPQASQASYSQDKSGAAWWEVVDVVSSPGFTISAFRKEASTPSVGETPPAAVQGDASPSNSPSQNVPTVEQPVAPSEPNRVHPQQYSEDNRHQAQVFMDQWTRAHPDVVGKSTKLAIATLVLSQLDITWLDPTYFTNNLFSLLRQWPAAPPESISTSPRTMQQREDALWHFSSAVVPKILGLMTAMAEGSSRTASPSSTSSSLQQLAEFAEIGFSLFGHILADTSWSNMRGLLARQADESTQFDQSDMDVVERLIFAVAGFHDSLEYHTSSWLTRRGLSLESLVDDLVSCVLMDRGRYDLFPATLDRHILSLLRNEGLLGLKLLDYQFHELRRAASTPNRARTMRRQSSVSGQLSTFRPCRLNGTWVCRDMDIDHVDPLARSVGRPRGPNERVRLGIVLMALLLSVGFTMELKEATRGSIGRPAPRQEDGSMYDNDTENEEAEPDNISQQQRPRLLLEVSSIASVFPEVKEQLELDGNLRLLPALANGLVPSWLGRLVFPFDDGVMDYSAYAVAASASNSDNENRHQEAGLELFLSFFYYSRDGSAWRIRVNMSEPSSVSRRASNAQIKVLVQVAVGNTAVANSGSEVNSQSDRVDWRRATPRERHDEIDGWESLTAFEMVYEQLPHDGATIAEVEGSSRFMPRDDGRPRSNLPPSAMSLSRSRNQSGFALV